MRRRSGSGSSLRFAFLRAVLLAAAPSIACAGVPTAAMVTVPGGQYSPFYSQDAAKQPRPVNVDAFRMDAYPVTRAAFLEFVRKHPQWRKSEVKTIFADDHYLDDWSTDSSFGNDEDGDRPVVSVSWFAAKAYCESLGKSLPTTDQWEYALADGGRNTEAVRSKALAWYATANASQLPPIGSMGRNGYGIYDLVGLVWEWTLDFNAFASADDKAFFCGSGSLGSADPSDFAAFMRYSLRASLKSSYTTRNLGFRCVENAR